LFLFIPCVAKKALEYEVQLAKKDKKLLPPFAPEYQSWKGPPPPLSRPPSDHGGRKRKRGDDIASVHDSVSSSEGAPGDTGGAEQQGIEPATGIDEHHDFVPDDGDWFQEVTIWTQEVAESLASLGERGELSQLLP
jgi:hypothetical protein